MFLGESECGMINIWKKHFLSEKEPFFNFGHFMAILAILTIFNISKIYPLRFFSNSTHMSIMTEIWSMSILVMLFGILWPQFQKWWNLGYFWLIYCLSKPKIIFLGSYSIFGLFIYIEINSTHKNLTKNVILHQNGHKWP